MDIKLIDSIFKLIQNFIETQEDSNLDVLLYEIANCIINGMNLQNYTNKILILDFYESNHSSKGCVDEHNNLCIFKEGIEVSVSEMLQKLPTLSEFERFMCKIILYVKTIVHETQHLKQRKLLSEDINQDSFETIIASLCESDDNHFRLGYSMFYDIHPTERLADITAYRSIIEILEKFDNEMGGLVNYIKSQAILEEFYYYYKYGLLGPSLTYLNFFADNENFVNLKNRIDGSDINFEDRLLYGFTITDEEYKGLVIQYSQLLEQQKTFSNKQ